MLLGRYIWSRYVNDTFFIQKAGHSQQLLQHINSIQFTAEDPNSEGSFPFLDTLVTPGPDKTLFTTIYRKPIHTDQYLHWDSHHNLSAKFSVFNTITHAARSVCTNPQLLHEEEEHIERPYLGASFLLDPY